MIKVFPKHISNYFHDNFYILIITLISNAFGFITFPIITHSLGSTDYGLYAIYSTIISFFNSIGFIGLNTSVTRFIAKAPGGSNSGSVTAQVINIIFFYGIFLSLMLFLFVHLFKYFGYFNNELAIALSILGLLQIYFNIFNIISRALKLFRSMANAQIFSAIISMLGIIYFYTFFNVTLKLMISVQAMSAILGFIFLYIKIKEHIDFKEGINLLLMKKMILYGAPLVIGFSYDYIFKLSDRYFLLYFQNIENVGLYQACDKISKLADIPLAPMSMVLLPTLLMHYKNQSIDKVKSVINFSQNIIIVIIGLSYIITIPNISDLYQIFSGFELDNSNGIIFLLVGSIIFQRLQYIYVMPLLIKDKTKIIGYICAVFIMINLILNYLLVKDYGIFGAALSTFITSFFLSIVNFLYSKKLAPECQISPNMGLWIYVIFSAFIVITIIEYLNIDILTVVNIESKNFKQIIVSFINIIIGVLTYTILIMLYYRNEIINWLSSIKS